MRRWQWGVQLAEFEKPLGCLNLREVMTAPLALDARCFQGIRPLKPIHHDGDIPRPSRNPAVEADTSCCAHDFKALSSEDHGIPLSCRAIPSRSTYHLAVSFGTDGAGVMTRKVFLKNGNGAINATLKDDLVAKATFKVITEDPE